MINNLRITTIIVFLISVTIIFNLACKKEEPKPEQEQEPVATSIELVSGADQTGEAGTTLSVPIEYLVKD